MYVNGARFHLVHGGADWALCRDLDADLSGRPGTEFDAATGAVRLAHREAVGRTIRPELVRAPGERRGAGRDRFGTWYWIADDERGVERRGTVATEASVWWRPTGVRLRGLAITPNQHLVVGVLPDDPTAPGGLLVVDLVSGGPATALHWPVRPFDLHATAAGDVLVLDRDQRTWWRVDRTWRVCSATVTVEPGSPTPFQDEGVVASGAPTRRSPDITRPEPHPLGAAADPVAITEFGGLVLVLDRRTDEPSAVLAMHARTGVALGAARLTVPAIDPARPDLPAFDHPIVGHDLAVSGAGELLPLPGAVLYVADASTGAAEAFDIVERPFSLRHRSEELPMQQWRARGLHATGDDVLYDIAHSWVPLEPFGMCTREREATLRTWLPSADDPAGLPFDSNITGCVWHRLLIDAAVPDGCSLRVACRAADDLATLDRLAFVEQPVPYRRATGSELAWHDPWRDVDRPLDGRTGTWETLCQEVVGRYAQLELTLVGTGRTSPSVRALRWWYPRFDYVEHYLPAVYAVEDEPDHFLQRMLANMEGVLTDLEGRIDGAWTLADPRVAPEEALDWLAGWLGTRLEPLWDAPRRRFLIEHADRLYRMRGTARGMRAVLRLYLGCSLDADEVFAPGPHPADPARLVEHIGAHRFRVVVAQRLAVEQHDMVRRIVDAARPANTGYDLRVATGLLVVGEAAVGVDTVVGESPRFQPMVIGASTIATGTLAADHPFDVADRIVLDRDRLGELPPL